MMTKQTLLLFAVFYITSVDSRIHAYKSNYRKYKNIVKEKNEAVNNYNNAVAKINNVKHFNTINLCDTGYEFDIDASIDSNNVICNKCDTNYYRSTKNTTCLHCPEGFSSKKGSSICQKDTINIHTYCPIGYIIGNDPFAKHLDSCIKCDINFREYMPYQNNDDKCLICPHGSVINNDNKCVKCPTGYYEKDNMCHECESKSYNDIEGSTFCKKCDNIKSNSYYFNGGINCDDNTIYQYTNEITNYFNLTSYTNTLISSSQLFNSLLYNNRRMIADVTKTTGIIGGIALMVISS